MKAQYVQAVVALVHEGVAIDTIVRGLRDTMSARRHLPLLRPVLERVVRVLEADDADRVIVSLARESDVEVLKVEIEASLRELAVEDKSRMTHIDPSLVGGSVVRYRHQVVDKSYKQALVSLYRSITTE